MIKNTSDSYGLIAKTFHWIIAPMIIGMLAVGFIMTAMEPAPTKFFIYGLHKSTGIVILGLVFLRLLWRIYNPSPKLPRELTSWHRRMGKLSPIVLYSLLFLMPISGYILSEAGGYPISIYGLFTVPNFVEKNAEISKLASTIHEYGAFVFIGILILHLSAALYHHFVLKNSVLQRMLPSWFVGSSRRQ
jgi:cytochrome b561